jgi:YbgC/YbaW family acyl-CoA thioester hydrolase
MNSEKIFYYPLTIKESHLDMLGHVNNATYLNLFEEARWEIITENGFGIEKMRATGLGPVILEITIKYLKELRLRDSIVIETQFNSYEKKIGKILQRMLRGDDVCCTAELTFGLLDLKQRKLIMPTEDWLKAIGAE